jgi:hypothetical protein
VRKVKDMGKQDCKVTESIGKACDLPLLPLTVPCIGALDLPQVALKVNISCEI